MTTRPAPAANARRIDAIDRSPPPNWTGTSSSPLIRSSWRRLTGLPLARTVEFDHVQEAGARLHEGARRLERVVGVDGLVVELPLAQADGPAVANVDGRQQDHAATVAGPAQSCRADAGRADRTSRCGTEPRRRAAARRR
jgi:hypothetical protein